MKVVFRLRFQAPPMSHWYLSARVEDAYTTIIVKAFFPSWRSRDKAPRPRHTKPVALELERVARASLEATQG